MPAFPRWLSREKAASLHSGGGIPKAGSEAHVPVAAMQAASLLGMLVKNFSEEKGKGREGGEREGVSVETERILAYVFPVAPLQ